MKTRDGICLYVVCAALTLAGCETTAFVVPSDLGAESEALVANGLGDRSAFYDQTVSRRNATSWPKGGP